MITPWVMPDWMEQYREMFNWKDVEKAVNSAMSDAEKIVSGQVLMLTILHSRRLLKPMPKKAPVRPNDPYTSHLAAQGVNLTKSQRIVLKLAYLYSKAKGEEAFIDDQLVAFKNSRNEAISDVGVEARRCELVRLGHIAQAGEGVTKYNNKALAWKITEKGIDAARSMMAADQVASEMSAGMSQ